MNSELDLELDGELNEIRSLMHKLRPLTYDSGDLAWTGPVQERLAGLVESHPHLADEMLAEAIRKTVGSWERSDSLDLNRYFREIAETGQAPLDWTHMLGLPMKVDGTKHRFGAASGLIIKQANDYQIEKRERDTRAVDNAIAGRRAVIDWLDRSNAQTVDHIDLSVCSLGEAA